VSSIGEKYIDDVLSGKISVSSTIKLTFERHAADLRVAPENGWNFDKKGAKSVFEFCSILKHSPDSRSWIQFKPEP
jgi:hypothetical protein